LRRNWSLWTLLALAVLSSLWADMPDLVLQKSIALFGATLFGLALVVRFSFQEQLRLLSWVFRILAVLSLVCVVLYPGYGISMEHEWMGVFDYKNGLGSVMGLSLLIEWYLPAATWFSRIFKFLAMGLAAILLLNADSMSPVAALIGTFCLLAV